MRTIYQILICLGSVLCTSLAQGQVVLKALEPSNEELLNNIDWYYSCNSRIYEEVRTNYFWLCEDQQYAMDSCVNYNYQVYLGLGDIYDFESVPADPVIPLTEWEFYACCFGTGIDSNDRRQARKRKIAVLFNCQRSHR